MLLFFSLLLQNVLRSYGKAHPLPPRSNVLLTVGEYRFGFRRLPTVNGGTGRVTVARIRYDLRQSVKDVLARIGSHDIRRCQRGKYYQQSGNGISKHRSTEPAVGCK